MKYPISGFKLGISVLVFGLSGWASAACYIGMETNASSVQSDSGNGTYACVDTLSPLTGLGLKNITALLPAGSVKPGTLPGSIYWSVPVVDGKHYNVELVSVSSNSGKRCNYSYPDLATFGDNLSTTVNGDTSKKTVTVCATSLTPITAELPEPPEPYNSTGTDKCSASFTNTGTGGFDVAIGYSKQRVLTDEEGISYADLYEDVAICAGAGDGQMRCINECVPKPYVTDPDTCKPDQFGRVSLACAQCESEPPEATKILLKDPDIKYCFYYQNQANETTFIPSPLKKNVTVEIAVTTGSNCYTGSIGTYGGKTYSYWSCPK